MHTHRAYYISRIQIAVSTAIQFFDALNLSLFALLCDLTLHRSVVVLALRSLPLFGARKAPYEKKSTHKFVYHKYFFKSLKKNNSSNRELGIPCITLAAFETDVHLNNNHPDMLN